MKLSLNVIGDSNDEKNFLHKLLLTNTQVLKLRKTFANGSTANIKLSKTQLHKIVPSGGFLDRLLGLPLMINVLKLLAKSVLIPLGLTTAASATDAAIHKKMFGSGNTTLIISNEKMNDMMKMIRPLEESGLLINALVFTKMKQKNKKTDFSLCY